jgi:thiamine pyrophosphate-dependent acetolactate synthase large subunit-like protein
MFSLQALAAAATHRIAVLIVVANNHGSASLKKETAIKGRLTKEIEEILSMGSSRFDCAAIAKAFGIAATTVCRATAAAEAIKSGLQFVADKGLPYLIDVTMSSRWRDWSQAWFVPRE